ncbi:MAG TPA: hypothetical protein VFM42_08305, partial [Sphingomicrobium sp.]|nr:hypothetical protein [Sphingomicrobium sp.]
PPPDGFVGEERGEWGDDDYARECSEDECDLLEAAREAELSGLKAEEVAERNAFFADLREGLDSDRHAELVSASIPARTTLVAKSA